MPNGNKRRAQILVIFDVFSLFFVQNKTRQYFLAGFGMKTRF